MSGAAREAETVVVVDDDPEMRRLLLDALTGDGFAVREEPGGASLIASLERAPVAA